ncbi:MAG: S9 family peptidase [Gemmatimonadetes bacterium]|nr:S9 family peptidase [Gemmatimonadota bacterium]
MARAPLPLAVSLLASAALVVSAPAPVVAQTPWAPAALSVADYERAERQLASFKRPLVVGGQVQANWLDDGGLWYRRQTESGWRFMRASTDGEDPAPAFDHDVLAGALGAALGRTLDSTRLPVEDVSWDGDDVLATLDGTIFRCTARLTRCAEEEAVDQGPGRTHLVSPDGRKAAFVRDHDLWIVDLDSGEETRMTDDGVEDYGYATNNAGWTRSDRPVVLWAPGSDKLATFRHDARGVSMMHLVSTEVGAPTLQSWRYPLPEDSVIFRIERMVVHLDGRVVPLQMPPDQHRSTICDHIVCNGQFSDVEWSPDGSVLAFVSSTRDHKEAHLRLADPETGVVRDVLNEAVATFFESGVDQVNWTVLHDEGEVLWWSQRDNWGHLYLYYLDSGALKRQVTSGDWNVLQVRHVDEDERELLFLGSGREPGDPYFEYLYKLDIDSGDVTLLTPDSAHHTVQIAPDGRSFVDTWSTPLIPARVALRDTDGRESARLDEADISRLQESGWKPPIPFTTKARDGETDLHGLMYTPSNLDPDRKYPIVNYLYPGPQSGSVGSRSFSPARRDHQAIAELGFIVVEVDAMGTPGRSKAFHDTYYGNMGDNGLPDQITTIRQLADRHPFMDLDRVGIWGHSGGGFASTSGILRHPDFYKVAVSQAGNHDNRNYEDDWAEKWQGLLEEYEDGTTNYDNQANQLVAGNLEGKLLLAHGTLDDNVPHSNTMLVADALIEANKDFDLVLFPNRRHGFGNEPYMMRRRWDYFVTHLLGATPPREFTFGQQRPAM